MLLFEDPSVLVRISETLLCDVGFQRRGALAKLLDLRVTHCGDPTAAPGPSPRRGFGVNKISLMGVS